PGGVLRVDRVGPPHAAGGAGHGGRFRRHPLRRLPLRGGRSGTDLSRPHPPRRRHHRRGPHGERLLTMISVRGVSVCYDEVVALDDVSLTVERGRVTGLIGMNGSGKSTLFKTITGMVRPAAGTVTLDGSTPAAARRRGLLGYVPQSEDVDWSFPVSVRDVVMMGRYGHLGPTRRPRATDRDAVDEALERVELTHLADRQIGALSGGQRKRAFVARGIAQGSGILLLDEPFAGVDKKSEATIV